MAAGAAGRLLELLSRRRRNVAAPAAEIAYNLLMEGSAAAIDVAIDRSVARLLGCVRGAAVAVLTGAGCSTESGIPDYRGPVTRRLARRPIQYRDFLRDPATRRRYWARSIVGWPRFAAARPNPAHRALAALESAGVVTGVVTQNVDRLHHVAGSRRILELHGALAEVVCLDCGAVERRDALQERLLSLNPGFEPGAAAQAPDGDADLAPERIDAFRVAGCLACGGALKPNVVFFGENVPRPLVERAYELVGESGALLVVGSSLAVFSGYRFVKRAAERGIPIAIVNMGDTRGDPLAEVCVDAPAGAVLPRLAAAFGCGEPV